MSTALATRPASEAAGIVPMTEHKSVAFEVKSVTDAGQEGGPPGGTMEGVGAVFHNIDAHGHIVAPGAFKADLPKFLADGFIGGMNHNWSGTIGHPMDAKEIAEGLWFKAVFDETAGAQEIRLQMKPNPLTKRATIRKLSIGYRVLQFERFADTAAVKAYWKDAGYTPSDDDGQLLEAAYTTPLVDKQGKAIKDGKGKEQMVGVILLKRILLFEVSPVAVGANDRTQIIGAKYYGGYDSSTFDPAKPLGDADKVIAYTAMSRLHDMLCMAMFAILGSDVLPIDTRLGLIGEACDQFKSSLLEMLGYFLAREVSGGEEVPDAGKAIGAMAAQFKARFGLDLGEEAFSAKLAAVPAPGLVDQSRSVVSAVEGFAERAGDKASARLKDGRKLSPSHRDALAEAADRFEAGAASIRETLALFDGQGKDQDAPEATPQTSPTVESKAARVDPAVAMEAINHYQDTIGTAPWAGLLKG